MRFIVVVAMHNMAPWIRQTIQSIQYQTHVDFRCLVGDDASTDDSLERARECIGDDPRFSLVAHQVRKFSTGNICTLIELADPDDADVIVLVDGDDYLAHEHVLERVAGVYRQDRCWITHGSYSGPDMPREPVCRPYPRWATHCNLYRMLAWRSSHLKTFKYRLWKHVPQDALTITRGEIDAALRRALFKGRWRTYRHWRKIDVAQLVDESGRFTRRCSDRVLTSPMLELAGTRVRFIPDILYIYRRGTQHRHFDVPDTHPKWCQRLIRDIVRHKPRLWPIRAIPARRI